MLFGSRASVDRDLLSDPILLLVAPQKQQVDFGSDRLLGAGPAQDVPACDQYGWQAPGTSPSPFWRSVKAKAIQYLYMGP